MKKSVVLWSVWLLIAVVTISCSKHDVIYFTDLPSQAQAFLQKYFPENLVATAEKHGDEPTYEVTLDNGYEIDFYSDGRWQEIDSNNAILPSEVIMGVLPENIREYLEEEYPTSGVSAIERSEAGYNVQLATTPPTEIFVDPAGNITVNWAYW